MTVRELLQILLTDIHEDDMDKPVFVPSAAGKQAPEVVVFPDKVCL